MAEKRITLNIRLRPEADELLKQLMIRTGLRKTDVIHMALHCMEGFEFVMDTDPDKPIYNPETEQYDPPKPKRKPKPQAG